METTAKIVTLLPRWMDQVGSMLRANAQVRTRCAKCGTLLRIELEDVVARHGVGYSLVDRLDRCRMVGCVGSTFYLASRTYGRAWWAGVADDAARPGADRGPRGDRPGPHGAGLTMVAGLFDV